MWIFSSVSIFCITVIYLFERLDKRRAKQAEAPLAYAMPSAVPLLDAETQGLVTAVEPLPMDLLMLAQRESEPWARESAVKSMYELYENVRDWNVVRGMWKPYPDVEQ